MNDERQKWLVETDWLEEQLNQPGIQIFDATWYLPGSENNAHQEYQKSHIPNAHFFDIDEISDKSSDLPHMLPNSDQFALAMNEFGISDEDEIIIYDRQGLFSAPRVWWTFRVMGHQNVRILNGGLKKWTSEGKPLTANLTQILKTSNYSANIKRKMVCNIDDLLEIVDDKQVNNNTTQILDARPSGRFNGEVAEPRPGLRSGHIPGSQNIEFNIFINDDGTVKSKDEILKILQLNTVNLSTPIITSCGSGVTAAILSYALALVGHENAMIYDGAWAEWGAESSTPVSTKTK